MRFLIPLLVLPIILISGCTNNPSSGNGVSVVAFEPDFSHVFSHEPVIFSIQLRNTGSVDATDVRSVLLGLDEWGYDQPPQSCRFNLRPPEPNFGTSGELKTCQVTVQAPSVSLPVEYRPSLRVTYGYNSATVKAINVGSRDELRAIENRGAALPSETVSSTSSPILLTIANKGPIRVFTDHLSFPVEITISNSGGGVACNPNCGNDQNWNKVKFTAFFEGREIPDCSRRITLFRGQSNSITCTAEISGIPEIGIVQKTIQVKAEYEYFIDSTTSVTVQPIPSQ